MKNTIYISIFILIPLLFGCIDKKMEMNESFDDIVITSSDTIIISGAYALAPLAMEWSKAFRQIYPEINIKIREIGTGQGLIDIINKQSNLAMISRDFSPDEKIDSMWKTAVARDAVVPIINKHNPYYDELMSKGLNTAELLEIFTSKKPLNWGKYTNILNNNKIKVFVRKDNSGAAEVFANFLHCTQNDLSGVKLVGDISMIDAIKENIYGIGFCNLNYCFNKKDGQAIDGIQILPIDLNFNGRIDWKEQMADSLSAFQRNIWTLKFPRNLCRTLFFISNEKPTSEIRLFLKWVLTDGQAYVTENAYTKLNSAEVVYNLKTLE